MYLSQSRSIHLMTWWARPAARSVHQPFSSVGEAAEEQLMLLEDHLVEESNHEQVHFWGLKAGRSWRLKRPGANP